MKNAYLVLNVEQIEAMLAAAKLEQQRRNEYASSVSICLEDININIGDRIPQISSWSVDAAIRKCAKDSLADIAAQSPFNAVLCTTNLYKH